ncbi:MAG: hypothetical protein NTZ84_03730 [Candidatus Nealsonbacteria bacterium]|nr:hypothetical protein [Candidatus Nealsonbacteria bacterium]
MPQIVSIIIAIGLVLVISSAHYAFTQFWQLGGVKKILSETKTELVLPAESSNKNIAQWIEPLVKNPEALIDTLIVSGPKNNEIITDTDQVTFKFRARVYPESIGSNIVFETKVSGIDSDWQETGSNSRTIRLKTGTNKYTFSVRAKSGGFIDNTPETRTFTATVSF